MLKEMCCRQGMDHQYIDQDLTYWENKRLIEEQFMTILVLVQLPLPILTLFNISIILFKGP